MYISYTTIYCKMSTKFNALYKKSPQLKTADRGENPDCKILNLLKIKS